VSYGVGINICLVSTVHRSSEGCLIDGSIYAYKYKYMGMLGFNCSFLSFSKERGALLMEVCLYIKRVPLLNHLHIMQTVR
jgi:hypothetical protein